MASRTYDFSLPATVNATVNIPVRASRVRLLEATSELQVRTEKGDLYTLKAGQGFTVPGGGVITDLYLINPTAAANAGRIFVGDANFDDSRITGEVSVIDQGAVKTARGGQFMGSIWNGANAGAYSLAGVRAVNGSTDVIIKRMLITSNTAGTVTLWRGTGDLLNTPGSPTAGFNKQVLGTGPNARGLQGLSAAANVIATELAGAAANWQINVAANVPAEVPLTTPIQLRAAQAATLAAQGPAVNSSILIALDWEEQ